MQLFGTKPNQIPTNSDLGGMAYLDPEVALPLGAMPLVGGAPIVERGNNANGSYIRYADGSQVCYFRQTVNIAVASAAGAIFVSNFTNIWTFPSEFVGALPTVVSTISTGAGPAGGVFGVKNSSPWLTSSTFQLLAWASVSATDIVVAHIAVGRWK